MTEYEQWRADMIEAARREAVRKHIRSGGTVLVARGFEDDGDPTIGLVGVVRPSRHRGPAMIAEWEIQDGTGEYVPVDTHQLEIA